jgi:glycosyltransferase involved in cell wall biosynthesis
MRILLSAFTCWPTESSEPGVAWRFATELAKGHTVWLLTDGAPGPISRLKAFLADHPSSNIHVCAFPQRAPELKTTAKFLNLYYAWWQRSIIHPARVLHRKHAFHLTHHITLSRYWVGSSLIDLGIPFIWGPVGAGETPPTQMLKGLPLQYQLTARLRTAARTLFEHSKLLRRTAKNASVAFVSTSDTLKRLRAIGAQDIRVLPQICFDESRLGTLEALRVSPPEDRLRLVSAGRLLYWKGFDLAIRAVAELTRRGVPVDYEILNTGPMQRFLESLAQELHVADKIKFLGHLKSHDDVLSKIGKAHVLMHPALHEAFGNVCLEALAIGKPVVCLDIGGPAAQISTACGLAAPTSSRRTAVTAMADYLQKMFYDPNAYRAASQAAIQRVRESFSLQLQMEKVEAAYASAISTFTGPKVIV